MTGRTLIIPAAGTGSRLGAAVPKALVPVCGVPMVVRLLNLYQSWVDNVVVVVSPAAREAIATVVGAQATIAVQLHPTGMLDAILAAAPDVPSRSTAVWITWCDQVAVEPATLARLAAHMAADPSVALVLPTVQRSNPYIHLQRDATNTITGVLHRREGNEMPEEGESDMGVFGVSGRAFRELLPAFSDATSESSVTRERNFLPFIPWLAAHGSAITFPATDPMEAVGVNTPEELGIVEGYLRARNRA
ncbi:MAG: NTP transferase domain-containing protein [Vicinamibacterales bacterium]